MKYEIEIKPSCKEAIKKSSKKSPVLKKAIQNKIEEIIINPKHYKPLKYDLAGQRRVHIMKSFVLKYEIDEINKIITFVAFSHHDNVYKKK